MKEFHISDVLTETTGRLVSSRLMDGVYDLLNFLTGDNLFTHQLPRAMKECEPWLRAQFPLLMADSAGMPERLAALDKKIKKAGADREKITKAVRDWVEAVRVEMGLPEMLPVYALSEDMHIHIDPIEEAQAMAGDDRVITVELKDG